MNTLFQGLQNPPFFGQTDEGVFLDALATFLSDLNANHPFREGNGRTQLAFVVLVANRAGWPLDVRRLRPQAFLNAMIVSFAGPNEALRAELGTMRA
jgi:cell filamentation protein